MKSFDQLDLPAILQDLLKQEKFLVPTPIQEKTIPLILEGKNIVASAQTGSGKTLAYILPMISEVIKNQKSNGLVLAPTRELAKQIADVARVFTEKLPNTKVSLVVGGSDMRRQTKALKKNPQIIVATPGRLNDHLNRRNIKLDQVKILVLDEGDRMLDMGFAPQIDEIFKFLKGRTQTLLYTATMPQKMKTIVKKYMSQPVEISAGPTSQPVSNVTQRAIFTTRKKKEDLLIDELNKRKGSVIIFTKTKRGADSLSKSLKEIGFKVSKIHGDRTQGQRNKAIIQFKEGRSSILCATDVAARGIDIPTVKHVINYDLPMVDEDYVHRIGRTARNGASGEALSLLAPTDKNTWLKIQKKYKTPDAEVPDDDPELIKLLKKSLVSSHARSRSSHGSKKKSYGKSSSGGYKKKSYGADGGGGKAFKKKFRRKPQRNPDR